jgi:hypothetical protein
MNLEPIILAVTSMNFILLGFVAWQVLKIEERIKRYEEDNRRRK